MVKSLNIQILSDIHIECGYYKVITRDHVDVVVLCGDIHTKRRSIVFANNVRKQHPHVEVVLVLGNHCFWRDAYPKAVVRAKEAAIEGVHVLEAESKMICGAMFHGGTLWTDFNLYGNQAEVMLDAELKLNDYRKKIRVMPDYRRFKPMDAAHIHHGTIKAFVDAFESTPKGVTHIICTHFPPSEKSVSADYHGSDLVPAYVSDLEHFMKKYHPSLWVHGHVHDSFDYMVSGTRVVCNPRGYQECGEVNPNFEDVKIINIPL